MCFLLNKNSALRIWCVFFVYKGQGLFVVSSVFQRLCLRSGFYSVFAFVVFVCSWWLTGVCRVSAGTMFELMLKGVYVDLGVVEGLLFRGI